MTKMTVMLKVKFVHRIDPCNAYSTNRMGKYCD